MKEVSMSVTNVTVSQTTQSNSGLQANAGSGLAMDGGEFMMILLAQLRNQNPLEPMDDKELISQMAQLNSLQELQKINASLSTLLTIFDKA
jgi:flagellar basal-body rod modification protein FlgD